MAGPGDGELAGTWAALQGEWQDDEGTVVIIAGTRASGREGDEVSLSVESEGRCIVAAGGERFGGALSPRRSRLLWDDGAVWLRQPAPAASSSSPPATALIDEDEEDEDGVLVVARHAMEGHCTRVRLPERAKFRHLRRAIGRGLGSEDFIESGKLMRKVHGAYRAFKDGEGIGEVREVLVSGPGLSGFAELADLRVGEAELSPDESAKKRLPPRCASAAATAGGPLTRRRALALQEELLQAFEARAFQEKLGLLQKLRDKERGRFVTERHQLLLGVHKKVLPRFGFEADQNGVCRMMAQLGAYKEDEEILALTERINGLTGSEIRPETWDRRARDYKELTKPAAGSAAKSASGAMGASSCSATTIGVQILSARAQAAARAQDVEVEEWPVDKPQPFRLFVAGSWSNYKSQEMSWSPGCFTHVVTVGQSGTETFQFLLNGQWGATLYPSIPDATPHDDCVILGPDAQGHGRNWLIGKQGVEVVRPGARVIIVVEVNVNTSIRFVYWGQEKEG